MLNGRQFTQLQFPGMPTPAGRLANRFVADEDPDFDNRFGSEVDVPLANTQAQARKDLPDASPVIRADADVAGEIAWGGFENQFATGSSNGSLDPRLRMAWEERNHGIPADYDGDYGIGPEDRPVYGYLEPAGDENRVGDHLMVEQYGDVAFHLKPEVLDRTTVTHGDSLGTQLRAGAYHDVVAGRAPLYGDPQRNPDARNNAPREYYEAQYHGGVGPDDIHAARLYPFADQRVGDPNDVYDDRSRVGSLGEAANDLTQEAIPWEARQRDTTDYVQGAMFARQRDHRSEGVLSDPADQYSVFNGARKLARPFWTTERWTSGSGYRQMRRYPT